MSTSDNYSIYCMLFFYMTVFAVVIRKISHLAAFSLVARQARESLRILCEKGNSDNILDSFPLLISSLLWSDRIFVWSFLVHFSELRLTYLGGRKDTKNVQKVEQKLASKFRKLTWKIRILNFVASDELLTKLCKKNNTKLITCKK